MGKPKKTRIFLKLKNARTQQKKWAQNGHIKKNNLKKKGQAQKKKVVRWAH